MASSAAARCARGVAALIALVAISACAPGAAEPLGDTPAAGRANARDLFGGLALRLGPLTRSERLKLIRPRYVRGSLIPSRVFNDTGVWTTVAGATRTLAIAGAPASGGRYLLDVDPDAAAPRNVGESRHVMHLRSLGKNAYEWRSTDELAVGRATPAGIDAMRRRLLASTEGRTGEELRALWQRGLPRSTGALGRLFAVDSIGTVVAADGSTLVALRISIDPGRVASELPDFAKWLGKYVGSSRYRIVIEDHRGTPYGAVSLTGGIVRIRLRTHDGILQPLAGPVVAAADSLRLRVDLSTKGMLFTVGVNDLLVDVVPVRTPSERGWTIRYRHEPEWRFPPAVEQLIRDALRRPFAGEGASTRLVARGEPDGHTLIARDFRMEVQESGVVRWLSSLGNSAMGDVTARVEQQKDRFFADALSAFGADLAAQIGDTDAGTGSTR